MDYITNELYKHNYNPIGRSRAYFVSKNTGMKISLHQSVRKFYYPNENNTFPIDHVDHNTFNNTIENLQPVHLVINSMNRIDTNPRWEENKKSYRVEYVMEYKRYTTLFSVKKYGTKESAYKEAMNYINNVVIPKRKLYLETKEIELMKQNLVSSINYFLLNDRIDVVKKILLENNILELIDNEK